MMSQAIYQGMIYVYYTVDKDHIIQNNCVNKAKPQLQCDGKCALKDMLSQREKLQQDSSTDLPLAPSLAEIKPLTLFSEQLPSVRFSSSLQELIPITISANFRYSFVYEYLYNKALFAPPKLS